MKKRDSESWLFFFGRCISDLARDGKDWKYWSEVFSMAGAASLAVAFIEGNSIALFVVMAFCLYGLKFKRKVD
jgi:hypothetical protein